MITFNRIVRKQRKTLLTVTGWSVALGIGTLFVSVSIMYPWVFAVPFGLLVLLLLFAG